MLGWYRRRLQRRYAQRIAESAGPGPEPTFPDLVSQTCTESQLSSPAYLAWCRRLQSDNPLHRKTWEFCYILQALTEQDRLGPGRCGLGFGVGRERVVAALAQLGASVLATDLSLDEGQRSGWVAAHQHARSLGDLNQLGLCEPQRFRELVSYRSVNMNHIDQDLRGFDFLWSSCALEHLGSIALGQRFIRNAMRCLVTGGVAVHTTELNLVSNERTLDHRPTVLFRRRDFEALKADLEADGHWVAPLNLHPGRGELDRYVDVPPYQRAPHLKLLVGRYASTSVGLIIRAGGAS